MQVGCWTMTIRTRKKFRVRRPLGAYRSECGMYMLELLVAVLASSILAATLASHLGETFKMTSAGQHQLYAAAIAQELVDVTRNTNYTTLCSLQGNTYSFNVNELNPGNPLTTRALMMEADSTSFGWSPEAIDNKFPDRLHDNSSAVTETITNAGWGNDSSGQPAGLKVDIVVRWNEQNMVKQYAMTTYISRQGIHNWG